MICCISSFNAFGSSLKDSVEWKAKWIINAQCQSKSNTWHCFRKEADLKDIPKSAIAKIAADSKYWLWINNKMVVREGELKRGPTPNDTYYDEVQIAPYLKKGRNTISVLVWYFGKNGFSHKSSGQPGLLFQCVTPGFELLSDRTWQSTMHPAFEETGAPYPTYRLSESNIRFNAMNDIPGWQNAEVKSKGFEASVELGSPPCAPWNKLIKRPIPQFKDYGLKPYASIQKHGDTVIAKLPYDCQFTPYLKVEAPAGVTIGGESDSYQVSEGYPSVRLEYVTRSGVQEFESPGYQSGQYFYYIIPDKRVKVIALKFRESGYNTEFTGGFTCNDPFYNKLWKKAARTLYITMRDNYMDCPDRERGQWIGDAVNEIGEAFYSMDNNSSLLARKTIMQMMDWQYSDGGLMCPAPSGLINTPELPAQNMAMVGKYGIGTYYLYSGDSSIIPAIYNRLKKYMNVWTVSKSGDVLKRTGRVANWGDWGEDIDYRALITTWYYLGLESQQQLATYMHRTDDVRAIKALRARVKANFNRQYWNGIAYRSPDYKEKTDDRTNAMAVVSGLADQDKYPMITNVLSNEVHASPYMEKYVLEALFMMNKNTAAMARMKSRYGEMVNAAYSTLWEGWCGIGSKIMGCSGTYNHGWSGGPLTLMSQYVAGISPIDPGFKKFKVAPHLSGLTNIDATIPLKAGSIHVTIKDSLQKFDMKIQSFNNAQLIVGVPVEKLHKRIIINSEVVFQEGKAIANKKGIKYIGKDAGFYLFQIVNKYVNVAAY